MLKEVLSAQGLEGTKVVTSWTRPLKVAYIIPADNGDLAVRAIESSCLTWGGADHIFVPYAEGISDDWMRIIDSYDADFLADLAGMSETEKGRFQALNRFVHNWPSPRQSLLTPGTLIYLAAASFLDATRPEWLRVIVPAVSKSHPLRLPILARYGSLNESGIDEALRDHGVTPKLRLDDIVLTTTTDFAGLEPHILLDPPVSPENLNLGTGNTEVWNLPRLTWLGIRRGPPGRPLFPPDAAEYEAENRKHADMLLVTGDDACVSDLCLYWTLRANRSHWTDPFPLWIPLSQFQSAAGREVLDIALGRAQMQRRAFPGAREILYVLSTSATKAQIEAAIDHPFPKEIVTNGLSDFIPRRFERGNREVYEVNFRSGHARIPLSREEKLRQFAQLDRVGQEIDVEGLRLPQIGSLGSDVPGLPWRISQRGFQRFFYPQLAEPLAGLYVPSTWRALEALFEEAGYKCKPSDKGRLAVGVLELLGSYGNVGILASSAVFSLLSKMAETEGRQSFRRLLAELGPKLKGEDIEEIKRLVFELMAPLEHLRHTPAHSVFSKALGKQNTDPIMKWLLERRIVFRGTELRCPVCGLQRWYVIDRIGSEFLCEGCQRVSPAPLRQASTSWRYRLNELYARAFDQGVLLHILLSYQRVYSFSSRQDALLGFYPGVEIWINSEDRPHEIDYVEVRSGSLIIGECKVSGTEMREADADKLMSVANALSSPEVVIASAASPVGKDIAERMQGATTSEITFYEGGDLFDKRPNGNPKSPAAYLRDVVRVLLQENAPLK